MAERKGGTPAPATTSTVSGEDWEGRDISGEKHSHILYVDLDLSEITNTGARCQGSSLRDVDLSGAWLHGANFTDCDLRGSDVSSIVPGDVELRGAIVTYRQAIVIAAALGLDVQPD